MFEWIRGKIVYRLTRNGDVSAYPTRARHVESGLETFAEGAPPVLEGACDVCQAGGSGPRTAPVLHGNGAEE